MQEDTVTRAYLTDSIYKKLGFSRAECADLVDAVLDEVNKGLIKDGEVKISAFGSFKVRQKKQRIGRNPKTKAEVPISARKVVSFYVSNLLKKRING
jgi:integration host factor subunit alpha